MKKERNLFLKRPFTSSLSEEIVKKDKENEQKPWKKNILNNIYISNGKNNYQILKELTQRFKIIKNDDISKLDWSKQSYLNNRQINQIKEGNKISKRVLEKVEIEKKQEKFCQELEKKKPRNS